MLTPSVFVEAEGRAMKRLLRNELSAAGFQVVVAAAEGELPPPDHPDIVVLDATGPKSAALEVMVEIRNQVRADMPIILLVVDSPRERIRGLNMGADDCLSAPFVPEELIARVRAVLRRAAPKVSTRGILRAGNVEIDLVNRTVHKAGEHIPMTRTEWKLLRYLAENAGKLITNDEILARVWDADDPPDLQYLRVWIARLRRKLEDDQEHPQIIETLHGVGYRFVADQPADPPGDGDEDDEPLEA